MKKPITYLVVYVFYQMMASVIMTGIMFSFMHLQKNVDNMSLQIVVSSTIASTATLITFFWAKWCPVSCDYLRSKPFEVLFWAAVLSWALILPMTWCTEQLPDDMTRNLMGKVSSNLMSTPKGYLFSGIIAPIVEEVVFRGAILRKLLVWMGNNPNNIRLGMSFEKDGRTCLTSKASWIAIAISAISFSILHLNPFQILPTFVAGLLLGWMYYRTGSIVPGIVFHWVNNSTAFAVGCCFPTIPKDAKLAVLFGGNEFIVILAVGVSLVISLPSLCKLNLLMKTEHNTRKHFRA